MENFSSDSQIHGYSLRLSSALILVFFLFTGFSQGVLSTQNKKAKKLYEKADKKYKERLFGESIDLLAESVKLDPTFFEAYLRMGSLYKALGNEDSTFSKFQKYERVSPQPLASVLEKLAFMSFDRGLYKESQDYLSKFLKRVPEKASDPELILLQESIAFAKDQLISQPDSLKLTVLPSSINRFKLQYLPSLTIDNASIYYTKRDHVSGDEDIVVSNYRDRQWLPAVSVSDRINTPLNQGACSVSADGKTMIFTMCDGRNSLGSCDLYISKFVRGEWSYPKNLGKTVNTIYWESQPSLSADGNTLYFASNRRGGYGGRDLWVTKKLEKGWSKPTNLGPTINTRKDETTPFIHQNGRTLYFSANGYPGMGGFDLFTTGKKDSTWTSPRNLGYPINTHKDEVSIVILSNGEEAIFAKEEQKNYQILDSRLVSITLPEEIKTTPASYIIGNVTDFVTNRPFQAEIEVVDLTNGETLYQNQSDQTTGRFLMALPVERDLAAFIKKKGYLYENFSFESESNNAFNPDTINIQLKPVREGLSLVLKNIYFETDSYQLSEKSRSEINNVLELFNQNPTLHVEIAGHTDNVGTYNYNQTLSKRRAEAVYNALLEAGIKKERLSYKGYADSQPLVDNTSEKNRKSNRRIEFRVVRTK